MGVPLTKSKGRTTTEQRVPLPHHLEGVPCTAGTTG